MANDVVASEKHNYSLAKPRGQDRKQDWHTGEEQRHLPAVHVRCRGAQSCKTSPCSCTISLTRTCAGVRADQHPVSLCCQERRTVMSEQMVDARDSFRDSGQLDRPPGAGGGLGSEVVKHAGGVDDEALPSDRCAHGLKRK